MPQWRRKRMKSIHIPKKQYEVIQQDAIPFLENNIGSGALITSLPDAHELNMKTNEWITWFKYAALLCIDFTPAAFPVIFFQTDRRAEGRTISKFDLCMQSAARRGKYLVFHKIVLRRAPGKIDLYRPGYSHLFCFGDMKIGKITADVIENGETLWDYGMGINATKVACEFAKRYADIIYDPFCGMGTVLQVARSMGMKSFGIEIDQERAKQANLNLGDKLWQNEGQ